MSLTNTDKVKMKKEYIVELRKEEADKLMDEHWVGELVRCKDCKYLIDHYGFMDDGYCKKMQENYNAKLKPKKDWFCADGERR